MFVWKTWRKEKKFAGFVTEAKEYKMLLDFAGQTIEENAKRKTTQRWYR